LAGALRVLVAAALLSGLGGAGPGASAAEAVEASPSATPPASASPAEAPERVVSTNLCTDLLALMLARPGQLVSVSHVSQDPVASPFHEEARALPANRASAEEIFLLAPDLVLAGEYDDPASLALLETLGVRVERFPLEATFDDVRANIRRMGALLGNRKGAEALVAELDEGLPEPDRRDGPRAVVLGSGSYTSGAGTLVDAVLEAAGLRNVAAELGIVGMGRLPLERLVLAKPDLIVTGGGYAAPAMAQEVTRHPVMRALEGTRRVSVPGNLMTCGTPLLADAVAALRAGAAGLRAEARR
jgi:iron complex transport system substrate-binding protein